jgi:2',3'-cyclic-nucleotide 2'-phosphodiesterase
VNLLFVGDVFGKVGRDLVRLGLPRLIDRHAIDLVIANGENAAGGFGITPDVAEELFAAGVEVMTSGNHVWDKKEALEYLPLEPRVLRPANYPAGAPGAGAHIARTRHGDEVAVLNLMGRVFMQSLDDPFALAHRELARLRVRTPVVIVDFHAEATSEKIAMGWHLDGRATAVIGTHTHVQTADERILPGGTAYITDVGMTGPHDGIIGVDREAALTRFLNGLPARFESAKGDPKLHAVVIEADGATGHARSITRLSLPRKDVEELARRS